jgi:uncharacterized protein (TIGR04255 family)
VVFERSPLSLVVCQVKFEQLGAVGDDTANALRERLGGLYPLAQALQNTEVTVGPSGAQAASVQGRRFASIESDWTVSLLPDHVSVETTGYQDWADFEQRLRDALQAVQEVVQPRVETRLGLRYVNELSLEAVERPSDWSRYLQPALVSDLASDLPFETSVATRQTILQLDAGEGSLLNFRHGISGEAAGTAAQALAYILDFDCFRQNQRLLDVEELLAAADRFNTIITSMFQWCLTDALWEELKPRDK